MVKILLYSNNELFAEDLQMQLRKLLPDTMFVQTNPDLAVVDDDLQQREMLRKLYPNIPFIFLSQNETNDSDMLDNVCRKPVVLSRLIDYIRSANNLLDNSVAGFLLFNDYELRPNSREILDLRDGTYTKLTEREVAILKYLYKMATQYVSKNDLQVNVWEYNEEATTHTVETHIYRLRQKVEKSNGRRLILTENGGYKLNLG